MRMKKFVRIICVLLFATAITAACEQRLEPTLDENTILLNLVCTDPAVKATEESGQDAYKENTIDRIDYFIYASDEETAACLMHERLTSLQNNSFKVSLKDLVTQGDLTDGGHCYVYVVANWPETETFVGNETIATLKAKTVTSTDLDVSVSPAHRFIMDSETAVQANVSRTGDTKTVNLYRLAAKLTMSVNIPASVTDNNKTYTPQPGSLQIYYLYATKKGTLSGEHSTYSSTTSADYFNYPYNRAVTTSETTGTYKYVGTAAPFYTYPEQWQSHDITAPYFKIVLSWQEGTSAAKPYYYKVLLPESMGCKIDRNTLYKFVMNIGMLGSETDDGAVEIEGNYYVVDWKDGTKLGDPGTITRGKYLEIAGDTFYMYGINSIEIPVLSSHNIVVSNSASRVMSAVWTDFSSATPSTKGLNDIPNGRKPSVSAEGHTSITFTHNLVTVAEGSSSNKPDVSKFTFTVRVQNGAGLYKDITIIQEPSLMITTDRHTTSNVYVNYYTYGSGWQQETVNGYTYPYNNATWIGGVSNNTTNRNMYVITSTVAPSGKLIADPRSSQKGYCDNSDTYNWTSPQGRGIGTTQTRQLMNYYPTDPSDDGLNRIAPQFRIASSYGMITSNGGAFLSYQNAQKRCASYQEDGVPAGRWRIPTKAEIEFMISLDGMGVIPPLFSFPNPGTYTGYWSADGGIIYKKSDGSIAHLTAAEIAQNPSGYTRTTHPVRCVYDEWYWGETTTDNRTNKTTFTWGDEVN